MKELTQDQKTEIEIAESRKELEQLTNEQLVLRALASLVDHNLPDEACYQAMANVLRKRARSAGEIEWE